MTLCINVIVRRQWVEREKLSHRIAEIPLNLANSDSYGRMLWIAVIVAVAISVTNGIHFIHPAVPGLTFAKRWRIGHMFASKLWNAQRALRISFIPSIKCHDKVA